MAALSNVHPGGVLHEEFLAPLGISQNALARAMAVPPRRINEIVLGKRGVTADTAVRLAAALGTSERFWLGLQADYDLATPMMLMHYFPSGILGLGLCALMASFMSGMAGNVTAFNTVWTYDIYQAYIRKGASGCARSSGSASWAGSAPRCSMPSSARA